LTGSHAIASASCFDSLRATGISRVGSMLFTCWLGAAMWAGARLQRQWDRARRM
jgi:hypothetical protein